MFVEISGSQFHLANTAHVVSTEQRWTAHGQSPLVSDRQTVPVADGLGNRNVVTNEAMAKLAHDQSRRRARLPTQSRPRNWLKQHGTAKINRTAFDKFTTFLNA